MKELGLQTIAVAEIDDSERLRSVDQGYAALLAENIAQVGRLRQPIEVRRVKKGGYALIAGGHRLAAARLLEWTEIEAFVFDASDDEARLAEIDENLVRHELNPLDRATFLVERKKVYERLHPQTRQGGAPGKAGGGKAAKPDTMSGFAIATADRIGLDERSIRRAISIATRLQPDVKARIVGTSLALNQSELLTLAKMTPDEQRAVVAELLGEKPRAKSVSAAHRIVMGGSADEADPDDAAFTKLVSLWGRAGAKAKRNFLAHLKSSGDLTKFGPIRRSKATESDGGEE